MSAVLMSPTREKLVAARIEHWLLPSLGTVPRLAPFFGIFDKDIITHLNNSQDK